MEHRIIIPSLLAPALAAGAFAFALLGNTVHAQSPADTPPNEDTAAALNLEDLNPKRYEVRRYESIWSGRSPFEIEVEEELDPADVVNPLEDYSLAGYYKRGPVYHVTIVHNKDPKDKHQLESGKPSESGFELLQFVPGENYKKSIIRVRQAGLVGEIGFDEKRLKPATGVKGGGINAPARGKNKPGSQAKPQPGRNARQPGKAVPGKAPGAKQNNSAAAKQIREMLKNRANTGGSRAGGRGGDRTNTSGNTSGAKKKPRRRVILPPSR
jgi:hypothetical protein